MARRDGKVLGGGRTALKPVCPCLKFDSQPFLPPDVPVQEWELFPFSAGVSMHSLLAASSGTISASNFAFFFFFLMFLIKSDCSGLSRQQNNLLLSLEEAEGCLLLWAA